jgi:hypothetical protein
MKLEKSSNTDVDETQGQKAKVSALAILAFTLGITSIALIFIFFLLSYIEISEIFVVLLIAILAIVIGGFALVRIGRSEGKLRGKPTAWIGIVLAMLLLFICLCLPLLNRTTEPPNSDYRQKAQFHSIDAAIELLRTDIDIYPLSDALDENGKSYCGAMKLCEAMMGQDLHGFNPNSKFNADGLDDSGALLYGPNTLDIRKGPYLPEANGNPYRLKDLYKNVGPFDGNDYVLCDEWRGVVHVGTGRRGGMPVLYYKADTSKTAHDVNDPNNPENIYDYKDNQALLALGVPGKPGLKHPLYENPKIFYEMTRNTRVAGPSRPYRADTYILLSAGRDGLYGTKDDIANFEMQWRPK